MNFRQEKLVKIDEKFENLEFFFSKKLKIGFKKSKSDFSKKFLDQKWNFETLQNSGFPFFLRMKILLNNFSVVVWFMIDFFDSLFDWFLLNFPSSVYVAKIFISLFPSFVYSYKSGFVFPFPLCCFTVNVKIPVLLNCP